MRVSISHILCSLATLMIMAPLSHAQQNWWEPFQTDLQERGILEPGFFDPAKMVSMTELMKVLDRSTTNEFTVSSQSDLTLTRAEGLSAILQALNIDSEGNAMPFRDVRPNAWYAHAISVAYEKGIVEGTSKGRFEPRIPLTMGALAKIMVRALDTAMPIEMSSGGQMTSESILHVGVAASSLMGDGIPRNAFNTTFAAFTFGNSGSSDININAITLTRRGLGSPANFQNVRLMRGNEQIGTDKTFTRDSKATFNLSRTPIVVASGTSITIEVKVDLNDLGPGFSNQIVIGSAADIEAINADTGAPVSVDSDFPVSANPLSTGATASPQMSYQVIDPYGSTQTQLGLRATNALLTRVLLFADSESIEINSITFRNMGSAFEGDIADLSLYSGNSKIAGPEQMNGRDVLFDMSQRPLLIERGSSAALELRGFLAGGFEKTVGFDIEQDSAINAVSEQSGLPVRAVRNSASQTIVPDLIR